MRTRGLLPIILANVIISVVVAFGIIAVFGDRGGGSDSGTERVVTFVMPTVIPTPIYIVVTATPEPGSTQIVAIPDEAREGAGLELPTLPPEQATAEAGANQQSAEPLEGEQPLPPGCIYHTLQEFEFPSSIAVDYEVSVFDILAVNNLSEEEATLLQIGERLIIPLEGCPIEQFANTVSEVETPGAEAADADSGEPIVVEITPELTPEATVDLTPSVTPTLTLAPTAIDSQVTIQEIISPGDITREGLVLANTGNSVDLGGWVVSDSDGNVFTFPAGLRLFSGGSVTIYTRNEDNNPPIEFFWGEDAPIFESGDILTLTDDDGEVQAALRVP